MKTIQTACGRQITLTEQTIGHLQAHPEASALLEEAIAKITLPDGTFLLTTVDFGRSIGKNACVEVNDTVTFAIRKGRDVPTHVVLGIEKPETSLFTVIAYQDETTKQWVLITGFTGPSAPREPHDRYFDDKLDSDEYKNALNFWTTHALVWEADVMGEAYESSWGLELAKVRMARSSAVA